MAPATVLVVENDPTTRGLLYGHLRQLGHRVLSESEGEWALGVAEAEGVDLVVLDQRLADLAGIDVLRRFRSGGVTRGLPVILLGGAYAEPPEDLDELAPVTFLSKPLDLDRLESAVAEALEGRPVAAVSEPPTQSRGRGPIPSRGDLSAVPFARLLGRLGHAEADGALLLQRSAAKKVVFFERGRPVFVQSNLLSESLGQVMLQERLITEADLEQALLQKRRAGRPLGDVVVERGAMSEHHLAFALERQMERKLFDLFGWPDGSFRYRAEARHSGPRVTLPLGPVGLVFEGAARRMTIEALEAELASERHRLARAVDPGRVRDAVLALEPAAGSLVERLDGTQPVEALFRDPDLGRAEAVQLVYALLVTGHLALSEPEPPLLSVGLRDQVRARLDAEMRRIGQARRRSAVPTPRPTRLRPPDPEEAEALSARIEAIARTLEGRDYGELLGVDPDADEATLRRAYRAATLELDPERLLAGFDAPDLLKRAEANHLKIVRAFQVLSDPEGRRLYRAWKADPASRLLPSLQAADQTEAADRALEEERFAEAVEGYRRASVLDPPRPYAAAAAAYAEFRAGADPEACLDALRAARSEAPDDPECMVFEARLLAATGRTDAATELYRAVVALDPDCAEALGATMATSTGSDPRSVVAKVTEGAKAWLGRTSEP
jgi:CheY-like chemotaxis protein/catechol 2,3-dioxygenase-like lactoylglutathione lyase family enzyme